MDVNALRDRILELSHDEATPDTGLQGKALRWLNSAYHEALDELQPYLSRQLQTSATVTTDAQGLATLPTGVQRLVRVVDATNNRMLQESDEANVRDDDPTLEATGAPQVCWVSGDQLTVYPATSVELTVIYLPVVADLLADGTEASIKLPVAYHNGLVWGALVWGSVYERGFFNQGELVLFQNKWDDAKRSMRLSLAARPSEVRRVQPYQLVE